MEPLGLEIFDPPSTFIKTNDPGVAHSRIVYKVLS